MSKTIDTGGSAFPAGPFGDTMHGEDGRVWHQYPATEGMTLRDWFAGQALAGILANQELIMEIDEKCTASTRLAVSTYAYAVADSMIEARKGSQ